MKDSRVGESLWSEWDGDGYERLNEESTIYYTFDHVDLENDLVRRALASALQRDGVAYSLANAFNLLESSMLTNLWAGEIEDEEIFTICEEHGETYFGDLVCPVEITIVEF